jgi:hypothetical protein
VQPLSRFPLSTSLAFAAAGASREYNSRKFLTVVAVSRAACYSGVAIIAQL